MIQAHHQPRQLQPLQSYYNQPLQPNNCSPNMPCHACYAVLLNKNGTRWAQQPAQKTTGGITAQCCTYSTQTCTAGDLCPTHSQATLQPARRLHAGYLQQLTHQQQKHTSIMHSWNLRGFVMPDHTPTLPCSLLQTARCRLSNCNTA